MCRAFSTVRTVLVTAAFLVPLHLVPGHGAAAQRAAATNEAQTAAANVKIPEPAASARRAFAARTGSAPAIDGREGDAAWKSAPVIDQFLEYEPQQGAVPRFRTELRVLYDDRYLYVLARMFDPAPDSIISLLSRRDVRTESEQLKLVIDSYHDRRTAFSSSPIRRA